MTLREAVCSGAFGAPSQAGESQSDLDEALCRLNAKYHGIFEVSTEAEGLDSAL